MRLLATADLHYNHAKSRESADAIIAAIDADLDANGGDAVLVVGDAGVGDGDDLERCLSRFRFAGPRLFVPGNHELWTKRPATADDPHPSRRLFDVELPRRVRDAGWHWLEGSPVTVGGVAVVGNLGWYDYAFADAALSIPEPFYAAKASPGAVESAGGPADLLDLLPGLPESARSFAARWNDGKFVSLGVDDRAFLDGRIASLRADLLAVADAPAVVVAVHHVPFAALLPPPWPTSPPPEPTAEPSRDLRRRFRREPSALRFARAYLGSPRLGGEIARHANVARVLCGHSHFAAEATVERPHAPPIRATNLGGGYREKRYAVVEVG